MDDIIRIFRKSARDAQATQALFLEKMDFAFRGMVIARNRIAARSRERIRMGENIEHVAGAAIHEYCETLSWLADNTIKGTCKENA
jgi:hypothetical protein